MDSVNTCPVKVYDTQLTHRSPWLRPQVPEIRKQTPARLPAAPDVPDVPGAMWKRPEDQWDLAGAENDARNQLKKKIPQSLKFLRLVFMAATADPKIFRVNFLLIN